MEISETRESYRWPTSAKTIFRPTKPQVTTKPKGYFKYEKVEPVRHCDFYKYKPQLAFYETLKEVEKDVLNELDKVKREVAITAAYGKDIPSELDDEKMKTIYKTDYKNRGPKLPEYRKIITDILTNAPYPIKPTKVAFLQSYVDPSHLLYLPIIERPPIFSQLQCGSGRKRTEYEDTFDKTARINLRNMQLHKAPLHAPKRHYGDPAI